MSIEIRPLAPEDKYRHSELMEHAFGRGRVVTPPAPDAPHANMQGIWGLFENAQLRAAVSIISFQVHWGPETTFAMGGIAGVATFAEARGRGFVEQLLRRSLEAMRDANQPVSSLYPFAWAFYRKQGWDWVGQKQSVKLPLREIKAFPEGRDVICLTGPEIRPRLEAAYTTFAKRYHGMFTAESHKWNDKLSHRDNRTTYVYLYEPTGEYFCWRYDTGSSDGHCHDAIIHTPEGYRALLSTLHYLGTQCRNARLTLPADSPLWSYLYHWDLDTDIRPVFMGRVVDVAAALTQMTPPPGLPDGSLTMHLIDEQAPWNAGVWKISVEAGTIQCELRIGGASDADVSLDIQAFSQAFWGTPSLMQLRNAGRVLVDKEQGFSLLQAILPGAPVFALDDF